MTSDTIRPNRSTTSALTRGLVFAGLMLGTSGTLKVLTSIGIVTDASWPQRVTMVLLGTFLVVIGNDLPKTMRPLSSLTCDASRLQRFQRLAGWTWVTTGALVGLAWLLLPVTLAQPITLAVVGSGVVVVGLLVWQLHRSRRLAGQTRAIPGERG